MKNLKTYLALALALVMCLCLTACGDGDGDTAAAPDTIEDMPIDDSIEYDYSSFYGSWTGENGNRLIIEDYSQIVDGYTGTRYELLDDNDEYIAAGNLQYMEEYGYVYANNEYDGIAYRCELDGNDALSICSLGTFTREAGDNTDDTAEDIDCTDLAGNWNLDGAADAVSTLEIDEFGNWKLYERGYVDGDIYEVDCGIIKAADSGEEGQYLAVSELFEDLVYDFVVADEGVIYWGGEYDCFQKMP